MLRQIFFESVAYGKAAARGRLTMSRPCVGCRCPVEWARLGHPGGRNVQVMIYQS